MSENTFPFPTLNGCIVEVWESISKFHPTHNWCNYLHMPVLKLNHVSKRGPGCQWRNVEWYGWINGYQTTTKHTKSQRVSLFPAMYPMTPKNMEVYYASIRWFHWRSSFPLLWAIMQRQHSIVLASIDMRVALTFISIIPVGLLTKHNNMSRRHANTMGCVMNGRLLYRTCRISIMFKNV